MIYRTIFCDYCGAECSDEFVYMRFYKESNKQVELLNSDKDLHICMDCFSELTKKVPVEFLKESYEDESEDI